MYVENGSEKKNLAPVIVLGIIYLKAVVCPRAKLHNAGLLVEREVFHIDFTRRFINCRWFPFNHAAVVEGCFRGKRYLEVAVRTGNSPTN